MKSSQSVTLERRPETYSRIRLWGSIGFIIFVMGGGIWFDSHDLETLPIIGMLLLVGIFLSSLFVPSPTFKVHVKPANKFATAVKQPTVIAFLLARPVNASFPRRVLRVF